MEEARKEKYLASMQEKNGFASYLFIGVPFIFPYPDNSEVLYELEMSKLLFPEVWEEYGMERKEMETYFSNKSNKSV